MKPLNPEAVDLPVAFGRLRLWMYGSEGPALLWCHGAGLCGRAFEPIFERLFPLPARVAALDLNGHGCSDARPELEKGAWEAFRQDIEVAVTWLLERFQLAGAVGHSGGGAVLAMEQIRRPVFPRLLLLDPILATDHFFPAANPLAERARRRRHHFSSRDDARARLSPKFPFCRWSPDLFDAYMEHGLAPSAGGGVTLRCSGAVESAFYLAGSTESTLRRLAEMRCPTLLVTGSESYMEPYARMQLEFAPPGSRLEVLSGCGHFIAQEKPDQVASLVREWFDFR